VKLLNDETIDGVKRLRVPAMLSDAAPQSHVLNDVEKTHVAAYDAFNAAHQQHLADFRAGKVLADGSPIIADAADKARRDAIERDAKRSRNW
jgi:hypothetical protein